jgi:hypothetical protein
VTTQLPQHKHSDDISRILAHCIVSTLSLTYSLIIDNSFEMVEFFPRSVGIELYSCTLKAAWATLTNFNASTLFSYQVVQDDRGLQYHTVTFTHVFNKMFPSGALYFCFISMFLRHCHDNI